MKLKKIIFSFIFAFLSIACVTGSVFLLQGCSQSTPKDSGGGTSDSPEDPNPENPDDEDVDPHWTTTHNFTIRTKIKQIGGDTYYPDYSSTDSSYKYTIASRCCFDFYWYCDDGSAGNLTSSSESYELISSQGQSWTSSTTGNKQYKLGLINATYTYNHAFSYKRYAKIVPHVNGTEVKYLRVTSTDDVSYSSYSNPYIYGNGGLTGYASYAGSNCTCSLTGTYTVYFAEGATYYFYGSRETGQYDTSIDSVRGYAGGSISMPSFTGKTPLGYTFTGWTWDPNGSTVYSTGTSFDVNSNYNPHVSWTSFHAAFVGNSMTLTLNANGGSIPTTDGMSGSGSTATKTANYSSWPFYDSTLPTPTRTGYTFLGWRKNFFDVYSYANWINQYTDEAGAGDVTFTGNTMNMQPSRCYYKVNGEWQARTYSVSLPAAGRYKLRYYAYTDRTDGNDAGRLRFATNDTTIKSLSETGITATSRTLYEQTFEITEATTVGVYFSWNYSGMCHLDSIVLEMISPTSGSWPADAFVGKYYSMKNNETLYAQWQIITYTLTVNYYGGTARQTNTTNLSVTASSCLASSATTIASGNSVNFVHSYTITAQTITFKLPNAGSYSYYLKTGSAPTTSSYNKTYTSSSDSYSTTWMPTANATINVFVYQRFTISYNSNNGSGTLPSTQYKIFGSSITLGTNSLTKTSYVTNGWNTKSDRSGTSYASGATYSANSNLTLYANWTPQTCTVTVRIKTSSDGSTYTSSSTGGTIKMSYYVDNKNFPSLQNNTSSSEEMSASTVLINRLVTFAATANSGYVFAGMSTSTTAPYSTTNMSFTPSNSGSTYIYYAYFNKLSGNMVKYIGKNSATYSSVTVRTLSAYSFVQNSAGFYESQNFGSHSSYALASVSFTLTNTADVVFSAISYGENNYDFGIFSNLNTTLTSSYSEDTSNVKQSFKGKSSNAVQRVVYENVSPGSYYVYVKYRKDTSTNYGNDSLQFKLETELSDDSYFYFEDGYFPQSYVGDTLNSTLNNASSSSLPLDRNLKYLNASGTTTSLPIYTYSGNKYAKVTNNGKTKWFKMEPIKWRLSDYDGNVNSTYNGRGKFVKNMKVVSDRVLWVGAISRVSTKEGWSFNSSSMRTNFKEIYQKNGATVSTETPTYAATYNEKYYYYGPAGQQEKVKYSTTSYTGIDIATEEEIKANLTDLRAKASDMVAFILGLDDDSYCDYWTRELGESLKNCKMITRSGMTRSAWLQNFYGVRFSLRVSDGSRV